jgi:MYXO-CTERM domain-containing protein
MASATSRSTRRLFAGLAALSLAGALAVLCGRTEAANPLTLRTMTVDGNLADWDAVLGNALQTTRDGDGSSSAITANCALYSTDRDCPMGGGAGNDLYTFAWTYDASFVYLYIERYGSSNNGVDFFFVADTNRDKRLKATGDAVIHARWWGSTGSVTLDAGPYAPVDAVNGDAIASASGLVDGYDLPGTNGTMSAISCAAGAAGMGATAGGDAGRKMELRIPWCAFGLASGQPFYWHVVSTNNGSLNTPLDNIGAPSGGIGSFVQRGVTLSPDRSGAVLSPGVVSYDHVLLNEGNEADVIVFGAASSQGARIELIDAGTVIGRDDQGDGTWELPSGGQPQLALAAGASKPLQVRITMPSGRSGQDVTRVTAASANDATVSSAITDTSHVGSPAFVPETFAAWTQANVAAGFAEALFNGQLTADVFDLTPGPGCAGAQLRITLDAAGTQLVARDDTGDGTWDFVDAASDVNGNGLPDLGGVAGGTGKSFWLWVQPPAGTPYGSCSVRLTATSPTTAATASAEHTVTVAPAVSLTPSYTRAAGTSRRVFVGGSGLFPAVLRNAESVSRSYSLAQVLTPAAGATARVWTDPNGDGNPTDGAVITSTGAVAPFGGTYPVVVEILAGTAASGTALSLTTTATATSGGASAAQTAEADVGYIAAFADALHASATDFFPPCATVYVHGSGLLANDTSSYSLGWLTPTATSVRTVQPWPTTALGTADDGYTLAATAPTGAWTARLVDAPSTRDQNLSFTVELNASVASLTTDKARYRPGDVVQVTGTFHDAGRAALKDGAFSYALDGAPLRTRSGVTVAPGATVPDPFTFTLPLGATPGVRTISAGWWLSCGAAAFATRNATFEVQSDPPVIVAPVTAARLATSTPAISGTAVAGAAVSVRIDTTTYAPVTAAGGAWSFTAPALADGGHSVTAMQTVGGVPSGWTAPVGFEVDTTPPPVPTLGAVASPTRANPVVLEVTAPAAAAVSVYRDGTVFSTTPFSVAGDLYTFHLPLAEGTFSITAQAADDLGNASAASAAIPVTVDRTPPGAPQLGAYAGPTKADPVPVTATADAGSVVRLFVDGAERTTMTEAGAGSYAATLDLPLDGSYELTAIATDAAGNASVASSIVTVVVDRAPPGAPAVAPVTSPTAARPVTIGVTAEAGVTLALWLDGGAFASAGPLAGTTHGFDLDLATGPHQVWVFATDAAGNSSVVSNTVAFDVDLDPPGVPTVEPIVTPTGLQPVPVTVTAEAGSTVRLMVNGVASAATPTSVVGQSYAFELTLAEGTYALRATAADPLGNTSAPSAARGVVVDRTKPASPAVTSGVPTVTRLPLVTVTGAAEAGSTVSATVTGAGLAPSPAPVVATAGTFSIDLDFLAAGSLDGTYQVVLRATDAAGNVSDPTASATVTLDREAPDAPVVLSSATSASPVVIHVTAEQGASVALSIDGTPRPELLPASVIGTDYSFQVALATGTYLVGAVATDAAGNASNQAMGVSIAVDNGIPATPVVAVAPYTAADPIPVTVTADAGMTVALYVGGGDTLLVPTVDGSTYTFALVRGEGSYVLTATAMNGAGTVSASSAAKVVVVDRTAPAASPSMDPLPALTRAPGVTVSGSTEPYATVTIQVAGLAPVTATADGSGLYSGFAPLPAADGTYAVTVQAADGAGNASPLSDAVTVEVDRTGPGSAPTIDPALPARTRLPSVTVAGTTEADATVVVEVAGMAPVTTLADAAGHYTVAVPLSGVEGSYGVTVAAADRAGNPAPTSAPVQIVVDTTPPASAPTIAPALPPLTRATSLTVAGLTEANATVTIRVTGMPPVTTTANATGAYSAPVPLPIGAGTDGPYDVTVMATDEAGNDSAVSAPVAVYVDRRAPAAAPTISPALPSLTNAVSLTVAGLTEANATVTIRVTGMAPVTTTANGAGAYAAPVPLPTGAGTDGPYGVTVMATDEAGNDSAVSAPVTVEVDRTAPAAAPTVNPALPSLTSAVSLTVAGATEPYATVTIQVTGMAPVATTANGTGAYSASVPLPTGAGTDGLYGVTVMATDEAGNGSAVSAPVTVEVDRIGPATAPTISPALPSPTRAASLTVAGLTEPWATVTIQVTGMASVTATANGTGAYSTSAALPGTDGSYGVTVQAKDAAGNASPPSAPAVVQVDRTAPGAAPTLDPLPTLTNAASLAVSGTTEGNAIVTVQVTGMAPVTTVADASGNYAVTAPLPTGAGTDGAYQVTLKATDPAGNGSSTSPPVTVTVDRTGPASAPTIAPALPSIINVASVTVSGSTEPNATVTVLVNGALAVATAADGGGAYTVSAPLPPADGSYDVSVRASDRAGNASPASAPSAVILDRTAPAAAIVTAPIEGATVAPGTISITGTAEPGASVDVVVDAVSHLATADSVTGAFQVDVALIDGNHAVTVTVTDVAGNTSAATTRAFAVATPPAGDSGGGGGGGCGCGPGGGSTPEGLLLLAIVLATFRRRRAPNPANLPLG